HRLPVSTLFPYTTLFRSLWLLFLTFQQVLEHLADIDGGSVRITRITGEGHAALLCGGQDVDQLLARQFFSSGALRGITRTQQIAQRMEHLIGLLVVTCCFTLRAGIR